ncbi:MAG: hypothetical protein C0518_00420 [Opitutus sp.]|nr:hypothetical protein [Opitutus sp.]
MHETGFSFSHLDSPACGASIPPGWHLLRGWVWPKPGGQFVDVRARLEGRVFHGVHGWPRADLAAHFCTRRRVALAEFRVAVEFPASASTVVLEALDLTGQWIAFQTATFSVAGARNDSIPAPDPRALRWHDFGRSLNLLLRLRSVHPEDSWVKLATQLACDLPRVQDRLYPPDPFVGHADEPAIVNSSRFGLLPVVGYLFHKTSPIARLWASADLQALQPLRLGRATANLIPHFPDFPAAGSSGYEGFVDVPSQLPNPVAVRLYAEMPDHSLHLVQVRTVHRHDAELDKLPCTFPAEDFNAALLALRSALRVRGYAVVEDDAWKGTIEELRLTAVRAATSTTMRPAAAIARAPTLQRATFVSHNLNLEGAPLFLLDLARAYASKGIALAVVSAADGVLRARFADLGAEVKIVDPAAVLAARDSAEVKSALSSLALQLPFSDTDLVVTNTFTTFWAVPAARAAGKPILSYVHESTTPAAFYGRSVSPAVIALADEALGWADTVTFTSDATRCYHARPGCPINAVITPGWVDIEWIDRWRVAHPRAQLRAQLGVAPEELLVTNIGTICDRKGQLGFARAVELFARRQPMLAARTRFILLGGRDAFFDHFLRDVLADLGAPQLVVHAETPEFHAYYAAADLTVCSSYEESSPRVVLEAMACSTPLLASDIAGIREIARNGLEATLIPAGHTTAWADALARMLGSPAAGREQAQRARARAESHFDARLVLPRHVALAEAVATGKGSP